MQPCCSCSCVLFITLFYICMLTGICCFWKTISRLIRHCRYSRSRCVQSLEYHYYTLSTNLCASYALFDCASVIMPWSYRCTVHLFACCCNHVFMCVCICVFICVFIYVWIYMCIKYVFIHICCLLALQSELLVAAGMLRNGAEVVRLMSRKYQVLWAAIYSWPSEANKQFIDFVYSPHEWHYECINSSSASHFYIFSCFFLLSLNWIYCAGLWYVQDLRSPWNPPR